MIKEILAVLFVAAPASSEPKVLRISDLINFDSVFESNGSESSQHTGEMVDIVCLAVSVPDKVPSKLTNCKAVGASAAWSTAYPRTIQRVVRVRSGFTGQVSLKFRVP